MGDAARSLSGGEGMARAAAARGVEVLVPTAWQREVREERGRLLHRVAASSIYAYMGSEGRGRAAAMCAGAALYLLHLLHRLHVLHLLH